MHVSKGKDANPQLSTRDMFTGRVHQHPHVTEQHGKSLRINLVRFEPGGRTKWHTHKFEQGLIVLEGKGIVATEQAEHVIEPGDVIVIPEGEKHWHGATETTGMAHFSINGAGERGAESTVLEPVTEVKTRV
jgi:quercetin dioxygenase-like cupin family protein